MAAKEEEWDLIYILNPFKYNHLKIKFVFCMNIAC